MADITRKNNSTFYLIGGLIFAGIVALILWKRKQNVVAIGNPEIKDVTFHLPTTHDPATFGPVYWNAFHTLAQDVPCPACQQFAVKFMTFFHDTVNLKTDKPLHDEANFNTFTDMFAQIKAKGNKWPTPIVSAQH